MEIKIDEIKKRRTKAEHKSGINKIVKIPWLFIKYGAI